MYKSLPVYRTEVYTLKSNINGLPGLRKVKLKEKGWI